MATSAQRSSSWTVAAGHGRGRDADADADVQPDVLDGERLLDQLAQPRGALLGLVQPGVGQQDGELVAAQPGEDLAGPQRGLQARADLAQQLVTGVVAEAVVDLLEAVEVEQQQGGGPPGGRRRQHPGGLLEQGAAVGQPGQLVGARLLLDLVERAHLAEGDRGAGQGGQHAADGQPGGGDRQVVAPAQARGRRGWPRCRRAAGPAGASRSGTGASWSGTTTADCARALCAAHAARTMPASQVSSRGPPST